MQRNIRCRCAGIAADPATIYIKDGFIDGHGPEVGVRTLRLSAEPIDA